MKLSIIIVSWNVKDDLIRCLQSLYENQPSSDFEVIVVDNASADGTIDEIRKNFENVFLISNDKNCGFAAANNQGIERSQGEYVLLLNPDTIIHPKSLDVLVKFMDDNKDVGACGPKLLSEDGTIQPSARCFPSFRGALYRHTAFKFLPIFRNEYKKWLMKDFKHETQMDVDQLMGSVLMIRRSVISRTGNMDENFFMYYEEVDLCYRIKQAGWRIVFVPEAVITHLGGRSSEQIPIRKQIMAMTSLLKFFRKHRGKLATGVFACVFKPAVILRSCCNIASSAAAYIFATLSFNERLRKKSAARIKTSATMLTKYAWQVLFKM